MPSFSTRESMSHFADGPGQTVQGTRKYHCFQIFCFGDDTVLLQFQTATLIEIEAENCSVNCWILLRKGGGILLRRALHRFLVRGCISGVRRARLRSIMKNMI